MKIQKLDAKPREATGTRAAWRLRKEGRLPAVLYGEGGETAHITVGLREMEELLRHNERVVQLRLGRSSEKALLHEVRWDAMGDHILHADFLRIGRHATVQVAVPIEFIGHPVGLAHGGDLRKVLNDLPVECAPEAIPESIPVIVNSLDIHDSIVLGDLELPEGVVATIEADAVICSVGAAEAEAEEAEVSEEEAVAEGSEPEVIGKGRSAEEEGGKG